MIQVMEAMMMWLRELFTALFERGGYIGIFVITLPIFFRVVRALRSIIKK